MPPKRSPARRSKTAKKPPARAAARAKTRGKKKTKATKARAATASGARRSRVKAPALAPDVRAALRRPPETYPQLVDQTVAAWTTHSRSLKLEGRSPQKLAALSRVAARARAKEQALRAKMEAQLRTLMDARMTAEDELWKQVLDVYRLVRAVAPIRPELTPAFSELFDHFSRPGRSGVDDVDGPQAPIDDDATP